MFLFKSWHSLCHLRNEKKNTETVASDQCSDIRGEGKRNKSSFPVLSEYLSVFLSVVDKKTASDAVNVMTENTESDGNS